MRNILVLVYGVTYIRGLTVFPLFQLRSLSSLADVITQLNSSFQESNANSSDFTTLLCGRNNPILEEDPTPFSNMRQGNGQSRGNRNNSSSSNSNSTSTSNNNNYDSTACKSFFIDKLFLTVSLLYSHFIILLQMYFDKEYLKCFMLL